MRDMRAVRIPSGVTSVLDEPGPNPENKNSAISVMYQVRQRHCLHAICVAAEG